MMIARQSPGFDAASLIPLQLGGDGEIEHWLGYGVGVGAAVALLLLLLCESA